VLCSSVSSNFLSFHTGIDDFSGCIISEAFFFGVVPVLSHVYVFDSDCCLNVHLESDMVANGKRMDNNFS